MVFDFLSKPKEPIGETVNAEQQNVTPFYAEQGTNELGKIMIDSEDFVSKLKYELMGWIEVGDNVYEARGHKLMNEKGASWMATLVRSHDRRGTYLTIIDDDDVIRITKDIWRIVDRAIIKNMDEWEMPTDSASWSLARAMVVNAVYFALRRGENGEEKKFFAKTHESKVISKQDMSQKMQKGFFG
jgi:hypothetical protein